MTGLLTEKGLNESENILYSLEETKKSAILQFGQKYGPINTSSYSLAYSTLGIYLVMAVKEKCITKIPLTAVFIATLTFSQY